MVEALECAALIGYTYTRSTGPAIGAFLGALRDRSVVGSRGRRPGARAGCDYDPVTSADLTELVDVATPAS